MPVLGGNVPDEIAARAAEYCRSKRCNKSELTRRALEAYLSEPQTLPRETPAAATIGTPQAARTEEPGPSIIPHFSKEPQVIKEFVLIPDSLYEARRYGLA